MKNKVMKLSKGNVVLFCVLLLIAHGGICSFGRLVYITLFDTEFAYDYTNVLLQSGLGSVISILILHILGYRYVLTEKGVGFSKGIYISGFFFCELVFSVIYYVYISVVNPAPNFCTVGELFIYMAGVFLTGVAEEIILRGVILNLILDRFSNTPRGIWAAVLVESLIFGFIHMTNVFAGMHLEAAFWQSVNATFMGILLSAVYIRSNNIWMPIILHALNNFVAGFSSAVWLQATHLEDLNSVGANWQAYLIMLVPAIILLRREKMREIILGREKDLECRAPSNPAKAPKAILPILLGGTSVLLCWTGMFWSLGIMGILAAKGAMEKKNSEDRLAKIGMILSGIGTVLGMACMTAIILYVVSLKAYEKYRLFLEVQGIL